MLIKLNNIKFNSLVTNLSINQLKGSVLNDIISTNIVYYLSNKCHKIISIDKTIITFIIATVITNSLKLITNGSHSISNEFDNLIWSILLPTALNISIWSSSDNNNKSLTNNLYTKFQSNTKLIVSFLFGCIGSIIGGFVSAYVIKVITKSTNAWPINECTGCLIASYIGGTANFFETFKHLNITIYSNIIKNIAAIDVGIMIVYFNLLLKCKQIFNEFNIFQSTKHNIESSSDSVDQTDKRKYNNTSNILSLFSIVIILFSNYIQSKCQIVGLSIMISTSFTYIIKSVLLTKKKISKYIIESQNTLQSYSSVLIDIFYTSIWLGVDVSKAFTLGPYIILLMSIMLVGHLIILLLLSFIINLFISNISKINSKLGNQLLDYKLDIDSIILASNACVGGSATAASMASTINRQDLILGSSTIGLLGYIIGTQLGLKSVQILNEFNP